MKKFLALFISIAVFILALFFFTPQAKTNGTIEVIAESTANQNMVETTQKTADSFKQFLKEDMQIDLTRDVKVRICPTKENYTTVLQKEIHLSKDSAIKQTKLSAGISNDKFHIIALNGSAEKMKTPQTSVAAIGHELFHQVQAQLSHNKDDKALYWLKEGTADLIGAALAEKNGYQSLKQWKIDTINVLRNAPTYAAASDILHIDFDQWVSLMEKDQFPYQMSDLMVSYLVSKQPADQAYASIANYFRLVDKLNDGDKAFEQAFGLTVDQFLAQFQRWFLEQMTEPAQIEVIRQPDVSEEDAATVERSISLTRQFFRDRWHTDLKASQRLVLAGSKEVYATALAKEFNFSSEEAAQKSKSSVWWGNSSTTVLDMSSISTKHQLVFAAASIMTKRFQLQLVPQEKLSTISWLTNGCSDVIAAHTVETAGIYTLENYKTSWLNNLRKTSVVPNLDELKTEQNWENANTRYGLSTISNLSAFATAYLVEKYGFASIDAWLLKTKESGDPEQAFQSVYGTSSSQFAADFKNYLIRKLK